MRPSTAPAGRVGSGPRVITYFSICRHAGRDDPENHRRARVREPMEVLGMIRRAARRRS